MTVTDIVTDPALLPVLRVSANTLAECQKLLDLLEPTSSPPPENAMLEVSKQQKRVYSLLSQLRGLNRDAIFGVRQTKQATAEARQEIDRLHLQLQNLYYEQRHLTNEIAACESYECVCSVIFPTFCFFLSFLPSFALLTTPSPKQTVINTYPYH